eukprot:g2416.t1
MEFILSTKATGTEFFKKQDYENAIKNYTASIEAALKIYAANEDAKKQIVLLYSNRSLCHFKLGKVEEAFKDADEAVNIDPTFAKGWVRRATALQANGRLKDAIASYDEAIKLDPNAKAYVKGRATVKAAVKETEKKREEVSQFAQSLVLEAMKIPNVDSSKCAFASDGATLNIGFKNHSETRSLHVPSLYSRFSQLVSEAAKNKYVSNAIQTYIASDPSQIEMPKTFDQASVLLKVQIINKSMCISQQHIACVPFEKFNGGGSSKDFKKLFMCENVEKNINDLAIAIVVDRGHARFFITKKTLLEWDKTFDFVFKAAYENMKSEIKLDNKWTSHASGCATSPWNDGFDAARVVLFPHLCFKAKLTTGMDEGDRVVLFGTSNCAMSAGSRNPIGLCFSGDILINDIVKTGEMLSNVPYRLKYKSASPTKSTPFEWMPFIPKPSFEFSVPNEQSEIDAILDAVQGGKQIPVFGNGNGKKPAVLNNGGSEKSKSKAKAAVPWDEKVYQTLTRSVDPNVRPPAKGVVKRLLEISTGWTNENKKSESGQILPGWIPADEIKDTLKNRLAALRIYCQIRDKECIELDKKVSMSAKSSGFFSTSDFKDRVPRYRRPIMKVISDFGGERTLTILTLAQPMTKEEAFSVPIEKRNLAQIIFNIMTVKEMAHAKQAVEQVLKADPAFKQLMPDLFDEKKMMMKKKAAAKVKPTTFDAPTKSSMGVTESKEAKNDESPPPTPLKTVQTENLNTSNNTKKKSTGFKDGFLKSSSKPKSSSSFDNKKKAETSIPTTFTVGGKTFTMNTSASSFGMDSIDFNGTIGNFNSLNIGSNNDFNTGVTFDPSTSGIFSYQR